MAVQASGMMPSPSSYQCVQTGGPVLRQGCGWTTGCTCCHGLRQRPCFRVFVVELLVITSFRNTWCRRIRVALAVLEAPVWGWRCQEAQIRPETRFSLRTGISGHQGVWRGLESRLWARTGVDGWRSGRGIQSQKSCRRAEARRSHGRPGCWYGGAASTPPVGAVPNLRLCRRAPFVAASGSGLGAGGAELPGPARAPWCWSASSPAGFVVLGSTLPLASLASRLAGIHAAGGGGLDLVVELAALDSTAAVSGHRVWTCRGVASTPPGVIRPLGWGFVPGRKNSLYTIGRNRSPLLDNCNEQPS